MNDIERLSAIETAIKFLVEQMNDLKTKQDAILEKLAIYETRIVKREETNGCHEEKIEELAERIKVHENELDTVKRMAWIGLGIIATLQFLVPLFFQFWR